MVGALDDAPLLEALASSQRLGMLGPRPIVDVVAHAQGFVGALVEVSGLVVDLGSGGGVPGLVIAWQRTDLEVMLVDRRRGRADHLHRLVGRLGLARRVTVACSEAADVGARLGDRRADAVVARSFGAPLLTATAAAPLLRAEGRLVVSEPPDGGPGDSRWPPVDLGRLGLRRIDHGDARVAVLVRFT